jgi:hypothetical protein
MASREVVELGAKHDELGLGAQQHTCANPRCDEEFDRLLTPGRPKDFHNEECRRSAERDLRRIRAKLRHHERQAEQLRARAGAYLRTTVEDTDVAEGPNDAQWKAARDAVIEVRGMARFLAGHQGEFAKDLLNLFNAVEPVIRA